jgi:hypothetical protein
MRKHLSFPGALLIAATIFLAPGASTAFAKAGPAAMGRGGDRDHGDHDRDKHGKHDNGKHLGQRKQWDRDHEGRYRFRDDDHHAVEAYYRNHQKYFRNRWRGEGPPLAYGYVIDNQYRRYCRPVPAALIGELPPAPGGFRYFVLGGNVVLVDDGYRVQDFIHIGINLGL